MKNKKKRRLLGIIIIIESVMALLFSGCNSFWPWSNRPVSVYGPPEWFEGTETTADNNNYDPSENIVDDVYGPPEWFE